jgi:uncharacterized protein (TIGR02145 family)
MRKITLTIICAMLAIAALAQAPQGISHQAVIRNIANELIINSPIGIKVSILQGSAEGTVVYSETHLPNSNANGLITFIIGQGLNPIGVFTAIEWASGPYFLKTEADPGGGINYLIEGTTSFFSVPYAFYANTAGNAFDGDMQGNPIINLADPTNAQDAATKAYVDQLVDRIIALEEAVGRGYFTDDRDGNTYKWVRIGDQDWMAENLNFGTRINGSSSQTNNGIIEKYCYDDLDANCNLYGGLYQWNEMMGYSTASGIQGICPEGWHLPTDTDWTVLANYVSSLPEYLCNSDATFIAKALAAKTNWNSSSITCAVGNNLSTNNATGFSALPVGYRATNGSFSTIGSNGPLWSSTQSSATNAWYRDVYYANPSLYRSNPTKGYGFSVRCLKD